MTAAPELRAAELRPPSVMAEQTERYRADVQWLLSQRHRFVHVECPACGARQARLQFKKNELDYVTCEECRTLYVNPRPDPDLLREYYARSENYAYWAKHVFPASEKARREKIFRPRAQRLFELCAKHGISGGTFVEVGAGFGTFCEEVRRLDTFRRIIAVEPTPDLAGVCRERGFEVIQLSIEQAALDGVGADVVASFEVIEHLFSPADFLRRCASILRPGGLLLLTCPNVAGFDIATLGPLSSAVDTEHLNYFHPESLSRLVRAAGLQPLEVLTPGRLDAELVRQRVLSGELDLSLQPLMRRILVEEWDRLGSAFQDFLATHGLSSHLWLAACRREAEPGTC